MSSSGISGINSSIDAMDSFWEEFREKSWVASFDLVLLFGISWVWLFLRSGQVISDELVDGIFNNKGLSSFKDVLSSIISDSSKLSFLMKSLSDDWVLRHWGILWCGWQWQRGKHCWGWIWVQLGGLEQGVDKCEQFGWRPLIIEVLCPDGWCSVWLMFVLDGIWFLLGKYLWMFSLFTFSSRILILDQRTEICWFLSRISVSSWTIRVFAVSNSVWRNSILVSSLVVWQGARCFFFAPVLVWLGGTVFVDNAGTKIGALGFEPVGNDKESAPFGFVLDAIDWEFLGYC